jgi:hypothetical protein
LQQCCPPHPLAIFILKEQPALQEVFIVTIDGATDMTIGIYPLACLDIDPRTYQANEERRL